MKVKPGEKTFWAYGGDFGPPDTPATTTSAATAWSRPTASRIPGLFQVKHVYQYIHCKPVDLATPHRRGEELV